jgi:hypothetical protein
MLNTFLFRTTYSNAIDHLRVGATFHCGLYSSFYFNSHDYTYHGKHKVLWLKIGRDSSVGIATRYGLDGSGIESRWGQDFPHTSRPALGPTQLTIQWVPDLPGVKRPGRGADHPPPSSTEVKERVQLYFYSLSGLSWPVLG